MQFSLQFWPFLVWHKKLAPKVVGPLKWQVPLSGGAPKVMGPLKWWAPLNGGPTKMMGTLKCLEPKVMAPEHCPNAYKVSLGLGLPQI